MINIDSIGHIVQNNKIWLINEKCFVIHEQKDIKPIPFKIIINDKDNSNQINHSIIIFVGSINNITDIGNIIEKNEQYNQNISALKRIHIYQEDLNNGWQDNLGTNGK